MSHYHYFSTCHLDHIGKIFEQQLTFNAIQVTPFLIVTERHIFLNASGRLLENQNSDFVTRYLLLLLGKVEILFISAEVTRTGCIISDEKLNSTDPWCTKKHL